MTKAAVTANRDKTADVLGSLSTQITLNHEAVLKNLGNRCNVILAQVASLESGINLRTLADALCSSRADAV